jgi:hypothetical protein
MLGSFLPISQAAAVDEEYGAKAVTDAAKHISVAPNRAARVVVAKAEPREELRPTRGKQPATPGLSPWSDHPRLPDTHLRVLRTQAKRTTSRYFILPR